MYVLHTNDDTIHEIVDVTMYSIPPNEPFEIENEWHAQKIMERLPWAAIVQVPTIKTKTGIEFDIESARKMANELRERSEDFMVTEYVRIQMEERVRHGKPALPPVGRVAQIIVNRRIDLAAKYNLRPIGWSIDGPTLSTAGGDNADEINRLQSMVEELAESNRKLQEQLASTSLPTTTDEVSAVNAVLSVLKPSDRKKAIKKLEELAEKESPVASNRTDDSGPIDSV